MRMLSSVGRVRMKTSDFIKILENNGWYLKRHGSNHDIYTNGTDREAVPRHPKMNEELAKAIIKRRKLK